MTALGLGVERLLRAGATARGMSIDEYKRQVLIEHACKLADVEMHAEMVSMGLEEESDQIVRRRERNRTRRSAA